MDLRPPSGIISRKSTPIGTQSAPPGFGVRARGFKTYKPGSTAKGANPADTVKIRAGETLHYAKGLGYYSAKRSFAAKKAAAPTKPSAASGAPVDRANAAKAAAVASGSPSAADLISQYNLARAKILQGMAPQVADIYHQAQGDLTSNVGHLTDDMRSRLFAGGGQASTDLQNHLGPLADPLGSDVTGSYNPDSAANAAYALGAAFPGESLSKQGAAFGAAAAFAPERALQEGQYALQAALEKARVSNSDLTKVSASVSKLLGYVTDAHGNPILGKNGKTIRVASGGPAVDPKTGLTAYQTASLGLRAGSLQLSADRSREATRLREEGLSATNARFIASMNWKSSQAKAAAIAAAKKGSQIDWGQTRKNGFVTFKDGSVPRQKNGHVMGFTAPTTVKPPSPTQANALNKQMNDWIQGILPTKNAAGAVTKKGYPPLDYNSIIRRLQSVYGKSYAQAKQIADQYIAAGEHGRPAYTQADLNKLAAKGIPRDALALLSRQDPVMTDQVNAWLKQKARLEPGDITALRGQGVAEAIIKRAKTDKRLAFRLYVWMHPGPGQEGGTPSDFETALKLSKSRGE